MNEKELYSRLLNESKHEQLSKLMHYLIILFDKLNLEDYKKWAELEYNGYD